tara:strand:- start:62054 stop:62575 length:522 start_codon:yes stop_codon:yes gene_type:complete
MAIPISSYLSKASAAIPFLLKDTDLRGGFRCVADATARDAIHVGAKTHGMLVFVIADATYWRWNNDTAAWDSWDVTGLVSLGAGIKRDTNSALAVDTGHLNTIYALKTHTHEISGVNNLQQTLDSKAAVSHNHTFASLQSVPKVTAMPGVTVSTAEPGSTDGEDGDLWFVVPA